MAYQGNQVLRALRHVACLLAAIALASCVRAPDPMFAAKRGRVVDAAGNGMPEFTIIGAGYSGTSGFLGGGRGGVETDYQIAVETDDEGYFAFPAAYDRHDRRNHLGRTWERWWIVTVLEPGFVIASDHSSWEKWQQNGLPGEYPPSIQNTPKFRWNEDAVEIEPIIVEPFELLPPGSSPTNSIPRHLTLKQLAVYYRFILVEAYGNHLRDPVRERMHQYMEDIVCTRPQDEVLDYSTFEGVIDLTYDSMAALEKTRELKPMEYEKHYLRSTYTAAMLCTAMRTGSRASYLARRENAREKQREHERYRESVRRRNER